MKIDLNNITKEDVKNYFNELKKHYLNAKDNIRKYDEFLNNISGKVLAENHYLCKASDPDCMYEQKTVKELIKKYGKYVKRPEDTYYMSFEDLDDYERKFREKAEMFFPGYDEDGDLMRMVLRKLETDLITFIERVFPKALNQYGIDILTLKPSASNKKKLLEAIVKLELDI